MKKLFLAIALFAIIFSCAMPSDEGFKFDNPKFDNVDDACEWIYENINYKKDRYDDWQLPQETIDRGYGDCEDMALLLMGIMKYQRDCGSELLIADIGNNLFHAIVKYNGKMYDCTNGISNGHSNYKIVNIYNYNNAMYTAQYIKNY